MARSVIFVNNDPAPWTILQLDGVVIPGTSIFDATLEFSDDEITAAIQKGLNADFKDNPQGRYLRVNGLDYSAAQSSDILGIAGPHHLTHENGGLDEVNVAGLSGELADPQKAKFYAGLFTQAALPTPAQVPAGWWGFWKDTGTGQLWIVTNDGGTVKSSEHTASGHAQKHSMVGADDHAPGTNDTIPATAGGVVVEKSFSPAVVNSALVERDGAGQIFVPTTPLGAGAAASKNYVDNHVISDAQHGNRGGGTLHPIVTPDPGGVAGFMGPADKQKLDGIDPGAEINNISDVDATDLTDGGGTTLHSHAHADTTGKTENDHHARQHALSSALDHTGSITEAQHGDQPINDGLQHAIATPALNGFLSAADKTKLDAIEVAVDTATIVGNALTTVSTLALADDSVYLITARIVGRRTDAADRAGYIRRAVAYREGGGGATLQGTVDTPLTRESSGPWNATMAVSGNNALIKVKGGVGATVNWRVEYEIEKVS